MLRPRALCHLWIVLLRAWGFVPMSWQGLYSVMPCLAQITKLSYTLLAMGYVYLSMVTIQGKLRLSSYSQKENEQVLFKQCVSLRADRAESWTDPSPLNNSFYYIYFLSVFATDDCKLNPKIYSLVPWFQWTKKERDWAVHTKHWTSLNWARKECERDNFSVALEYLMLKFFKMADFQVPWIEGFKPNDPVS